MRTTDVRRARGSQLAPASVERENSGGRAALARRLAIASLVLLAAREARAQTAVPAQPSVSRATDSAVLAAARRIRTGATIRVLASDPQLALTGRLAARPDSSSLTVITGLGRRVRRHTVALGGIDSLWVQKHPYKRNMIIGAIFPGLLFGAAFDGLGGCASASGPARRCGASVCWPTPVG